MDIFSFLMLLAGLSFFLYGMNIMGSGLEKRAGSRLRGLLEKATSRPIKGVLLGTGVTSVIQSSSATTVMVVGFVNAGVLTLERTVGIIMGANIGTTITAWILSLTGIRSTNILLQMFKPANFSPILAAIGVVLVFFQKKERQRDIGQTLLGFAILMFGMEFMSGAVKPLGELESFRSTLTLFSNPIIGVLVGTVFTAIIQSSSASIGILQAMSLSVNISFATALPILMGQNIGTCITALLSCVGANTDAKRAAFVHLYFNIIGVALFMAVFLVLKSLSLPIMAVPVNPVMIATFHTTFNVINTAIQLPFSNKLARLATISIKSKGKDEIFQPLDDRLLSTPSVAISQCRSLAVDMARLAKETMADALSLINKYDEDVAQKVEKGEEELDMYEDHLGTFLVKISARSLSEKDSNAASTILHSIGDFERIGDHAQNILESAKEMNDKIICFSPA
ncbi:MAG: Na/Pi cotransporter family protein, partial [Oscillospiraceae bacterium]